jgi:hypothetical protein
MDWSPSRREYFAGMAMQGILHLRHTHHYEIGGRQEDMISSHVSDCSGIAHSALEMADALITELNK